MQLLSPPLDEKQDEAEDRSGATLVPPSDFFFVPPFSLPPPTHIWLGLLVF